MEVALFIDVHAVKISVLTLYNNDYSRMAMYHGYTAHKLAN